MFSTLILVLSAVLSFSAVSYAVPMNVTARDDPNGPFTGGVATYYYQYGNPGACGNVNSDDALICALDESRFGTSGPASPFCGSQVQITNLDTQQTIIVTVQDDCPSCLNENSIDLSLGAFRQLADPNIGVFNIEWSFV